MKKIKKFLPLLVLVAILFTACDKADDLPFYPSATASVLNASGTDLAPARVDSNETILTLSWTRATHAISDTNTIKYTIDIDSTGKNFSNPLTKVVSGSLSTSFMAKELNNYLLNKGYEPGVLVSLDVRLTSSFANNNERTSSNIIKLNYTPYAIRVIIEYEFPNALTVAGNFQGWAPVTGPKLVDTTAIGTTGTAYEGYISFTDPSPEFKFVKGNDWSAGDFGSAGTGKLGGSDNLTLPAEGMYRIKVNTVAMTWSYTKIDTWGIIGSSTPNNWDASTPMTLNPDGTYSVTAALTVGELKFRANNEWVVDFGDNTSNGGPDNVPDYGGSNIAISEAGNYIITLDLSKAGNYYYTIRKI